MLRLSVMSDQEMSPQMQAFVEQEQQRMMFQQWVTYDTVSCQRGLLGMQCMHCIVSASALQVALQLVKCH